MEKFIPKHIFNRIKKLTTDFRSTLKFCPDPVIIDSNRSMLKDNINMLFDDLTEEQTNLLNIDNLMEPVDVDHYISDLMLQVKSLKPISDAQIKKLFKKEKSFKIPADRIRNRDKVYLGWMNETTRKIHVVYELNDKPVGMTLNIDKSESNKMKICKLCNHAGQPDDVVFVSAKCKSKDVYQTIGFSVCADSQECNERMVSTENLEGILRKVNDMQ